MILSLTQKEFQQGFEVPSLGITVYSYEGFCYYLYEHLEAFMDTVPEGLFVDWIRDVLLLDDLANTLKIHLKSCQTTLEMMLEILMLCPVTKDFDMDDFKMRYERYVDAPVNIRYKMTGNEHFQRGDYVGALSWYLSAQASVYTVEVENNIGLIYLYNNQLGKALEVFKGALSHGEHIEVRLNMVKLLIVMTRYAEALEVLDKTGELFEADLLWYYYGTVYEALLKYEEALGAYMHCYDLDKSKLAYDAIIKLEIKMGHYGNAIKHIEHEALAFDKKDRMMALLSLAKGDETSYIDQMEKAIEVVYDKTELQLELSKYYLDNSQLIKAIEYIALIKVSEQESEDVKLQKALIANTAGNISGFETQVRELLTKWKKEVRNFVGRAQ